MRRSSKWIPSLGFAALFGFATPCISSAAPDPSGFEDLSAEQQAELRKAAELIAQGKDRDDPEVLRHVNAAAAYGQAAGAAAKNEGLAGELERLRAQIERDKARAERDREMYDKPSVWEQAGAQLLQALIGMLMDVGKQKLNDWVNGGGEDDQLLDQIRELEEERTRLEEELAGGGINGPGGPGNNGGLGEVITDANGNTGYDTDGNGFPDSPGNDGTNPILTTPGSVLPGGPLSTDTPSSLDKDDSSADSVPGSVAGGGGIGSGGAAGPGLGFGGGGGTPSVGAGGLAPGAAGAEGPGSEEDPDAAGLAGAAGAGGEAGTLDGAEGDEGALGKSGSGANGEDGAAPGTKKAFGRVIVLPKLEFEDLAGNRKANDDWSEEWKDDSWDDSADNGDFDEDWSNDDDWGGEWDAAAKKGKNKGSDVETTTAEDQKTAELVDQIIRVETAVAEWRQLEAKAKQAGVDPYGFKDEMGYRAAGEAEHDPFKDVRTKEGKIDLTKVDVWLISEETWRDGEEPVRYKLSIDPDDVTDFEPIHGGVAMVQGVVSEVDVDKRVMEEIKGDVQVIEVERVLLSAEKPPAEGDELGDESDPFSEDSETPAPLPADGSEPKQGLDAPAPKPLPEKSDAPKDGGSDDEDDWGSW